MTVPGADLSLVFNRATKVIVVADVVESVRLMERDEHGFIQRWHAFVRQVLTDVLPGQRGRMHKSLGDGLMLEFEDAHGGVQGALAMQALARQLAAGLPPDDQMQLRIGAHLARFVADEHDIYGTDVNLTARIASLAGPGEVVITPELKDRLAAGIDADIEDLGECYLKHVKEPVRVFRVGPAGRMPVLHGMPQGDMDLRPTIAVIPFAVRSLERGHEFLGEALADDIIAALSRTSELHVISRLSTTVFSERHQAIDEIRSHLGASYVLSGTARTSGTQLALFVELIDAKSGHVVWADSLRGQLGDLFMPDADMGARLVAGISSAVIAHQLERTRHHALPTLEGYSLLLGSVALMHRNTRSDFERSREMLEHLVERSKRHPIPRAWLAKWYVLKAQQGWSDEAERDARTALDCTSRALDVAPDCTLALTVEGLVRTNLLHDMPGAQARYEEALAINPNESLAWLLRGTMHAFCDEGELASRCTERALKLSPLDPLRYFYDSLAATAALSNRDWARARELAERSLRANRMHTSTLRALTIAQVQLGLLEDARRTAQQLLKLEPQFTVGGFVAKTPARGHHLGQVAAEALRQAGVPN